MSFNLAIDVSGLSKMYKIYKRPRDRLFQTLSFGRKALFQEFWALRDVNFQIKKGETVGIVGQNGSGKSTLLQIIAGTLSPTVGTVKVNGRVAALLELGSGFNPEFTGRENVFLNGAILGFSRLEMESLYDKIVEFADIGEHIDQPVKAYSSGMAVRLAFAVQAMVPKEILIVDEALAVGDELFQRKCYAKIEDFKKAGGTILFVSHSATTVVELCDRAMLLDHGVPLIFDSSKKVVDLYQKMLYVPSEKRELMVQEIVKMSRELIGETEEQATQGTEGEKPDNVKYERKSTFDPYLVPRNTLQYETRGVKIFNQGIYSMQGERVNLLVAGKKYIWRYYVRFKKACRNVRFGMLIKTASGYELGGSTTSRTARGIQSVEAGTTIKVDFTFHPALNEGTYFLNAGVLAMYDEGELFASRLIDAAAFKIIEKKQELMTSVVDFDVISQFTYGAELDESNTPKASCEEELVK